jgi:protein-S-isoprenylcysteine O-methyltransferase Ste14
MQLIDKMHQEGNTLFKYRGQFPIILFCIAIPVIGQTSYYMLLNEIALSFIQYIAILISTIGILFRYYIIITTPIGTSGRNRSKQIAASLNTTGAYSLVRHPLYVANYLIWIGISLYSVSLLFCVCTTALFMLQYERIILAEEKFLSQSFGLKFRDFCNQIPIFIPSITNYKQPIYYFSIKKIIRREYISTIITIISFVYIDIINYWLFNLEGKGDLKELINQYQNILYILISIVIILKIVKNYTSLLLDKT